MDSGWRRLMALSLSRFKISPNRTKSFCSSSSSIFLLLSGFNLVKTGTGGIINGLADLNTNESEEEDSVCIYIYICRRFQWLYTCRWRFVGFHLALHCTLYLICVRRRSTLSNSIIVW